MIRHDGCSPVSTYIVVTGLKTMKLRYVPEIHGHWAGSGRFPAPELIGADALKTTAEDLAGDKN